MTDRFDLEQSIMKCWNVTDDIDLLYRRYYDTDSMTKDDVANYLLGLITVYNCRFEELFETFSDLVKEQRYKGKGLAPGTAEDFKATQQWAEDYEYNIGKACVEINSPQSDTDEDRCIGCEACIDSACGREDCPRGWKESASTAYIRGLEDGARQDQIPMAVLQAISNAGLTLVKTLHGYKLEMFADCEAHRRIKEQNNV